MITTAEIARRIEKHRLPLLTLSEFFDGNTQEESLAPNQWGYGRPPLAEIAARLRQLEQDAEVAWIRVELHDDTEIDQEDGDVCAESIVICSKLTNETLEARLDAIEGLQSDGCFFSKAKLGDLGTTPAVPEHYHIAFLSWD